MLVDDLDLRELLEVDPAGGAIRFAGQRALLLDATAMGALRKYLVENFGLIAARTVLTQYGFAHGWRLAETSRSQFRWENDEEWRRAGVRLHALAGLFGVGAGSEGPVDEGGMTLLNSYEAEQHLLHFGRSDVPVCWTICGLLSGHLSRSEGRELVVLEDRCVGRGDAACHVVGRTREEWGRERADEVGFFEATGLRAHLDVSLQRVTETLKVAERRLRETRRALVIAAPEVEEPSGIVARGPRMRHLVEGAMLKSRSGTLVGTSHGGTPAAVGEHGALQFGPASALRVCTKVQNALGVVLQPGHARPLQA